MKKIKPKISVCLPIYNSALYLKECIDSILSQTFKDFELLIVDDGSTDDSACIVRGFKDSRIRFIQKEHDFISSLNRLLDEACGTYIARMDADDIMMPDRLGKQYRYMESHPEIDVLGGSMLCIGGEEERVVCYTDRIVTPGDLLNGFPISNPTVMMRADSIATIRYERQFVYAEDYHFWCQALKAGLKIVSLKDVLIKYRLTSVGVGCVHAVEQREAAQRAKREMEEWITSPESLYANTLSVPLQISKKKLSVIITFLNEGAELIHTVAGIRDTVGDMVDIIVINDCSYDGYPYGEKLISYDVHYIVNRHRMGVAASRDFGVKLCQTPYFLLLDAHMRFYDNNWANRIIEELLVDERQLLCCQSCVLYKNDITGEVEKKQDAKTTFGAFSPFQRDGIWPDITWNYKERCPNERVENIPLVLGAAYAASKTYWQHLRGLEGLHNYGADEQYISYKVWLEGGRCTLLKDVVIGHIYRKKAPYLILGRDSIYNLIFIAKLLFPQEMYSKSVAAAIAFHRELAQEAIATLEANEKEVEDLKSYLHNIFTRTVESLLPMHQFCRGYDEWETTRLVKILPNIATRLQENWPEDNGLMEGKTGVLLWLCHYEKWFPDISVNDMGLALYTIIETYVEKQRLPWNFSYGLSGIGWGMLYLYAKGLINERPDFLTDLIDEQLCAVNPECVRDFGLSLGAAGVLAYLTLRLTFGRAERPALPLELWYQKAKTILLNDNRQETVYYAHLFCAIYEEKIEKIQPLIGVWLNAPVHIPQIMVDSRYTLADGILGTTLQLMSLIQITKN